MSCSIVINSKYLTGPSDWWGNFSLVMGQEEGPSVANALYLRSRSFLV